MLMRRPTALTIAGIVCAWLLAGCGKPAASSTPASVTASRITTHVVTNVPTSQPDQPKAGEKICFACNGTGTVKCMAPGCVDGMVDCPGPCLKLDRGVWVHLAVAGHPASDVWQKFYQSDGSYRAFNQNHVGHVIVMENGQAVDTGPCRICGGTGKVPCSVCKGTGRVVCPICGGKKFIPVAWTPTNNPWLDSQPDLIRLRDGRILFGAVVNTIGTDVTIKTRDGRWLHVDVTNVAPSSGAIATNAAN
ncbi:MAG: hypothetical protein KGJ60_12160 [Verrucomicrobiota bacterium]|nr:hypothetical protein [Verrucomicrobiota bacterium]